jgi:hypothetical protein
MNKRLLLRFPLLPVFIFFCVFTFSANNLFAQASESQVKITVSIKETGYSNIDDKGKNRLVWKFYKGSGHNQDSVLTNAKFESCFLIKSKKNNKTKEISEEKDDLKPFLANITGFKITMEAFLNKKGGEKCISDPKDTYYGIKTEHIIPDNLASGVWSNEIKIVDAFGVFFAIIVYKYELLTGLNAIEFSSNNLTNDASKNIVLSLPIKLPKKEMLPFTWSYSTGNEENWAAIPNSGADKSKIEFNPLIALFANRLSKPTQVKFKAAVEMGGKTESSDILTLAFAPPPPEFNKEKDILLTPVCNGSATGSIEIKNIKTTAPEIKYVLRKKTATAEPCNFKDPSVESCPDFIRAGTVSGKSNFRIRNLAAGDYVIYIFNGDLESGEVNTSATFTISELAPLKNIDQDQIIKDPTCTNPRSGEIHMNVEGGKNLWQIAIIPNVVPDKGKIVWEGNNLSFKNLEAGKYTVYLTDQCGGDGHEIRKTFILKKPKQISIDTKNISPLQDKADFYIQLNILNGSNDYKVKVTDQDNIVSESNFSFLPDMKIPISKVGTYNIEIIDNVKPECPSVKVKIKVDKSANPKKEKFKIKVLDE